MTPTLLRELALLFRVESSHNPHLRPCTRLWHHEVDPSEDERARLDEDAKRIAARAGELDSLASLRLAVTA